jgi:FixJ family two-component response regulator
MVSPTYESKCVAIVDDDARMREALIDLLDESGFAARAFASGEEFLASEHQHECSCLIADIRLTGMTGLDLQSRLNAEQLRFPIIFITAHGDERLRLQALQSGAVAFLAKPFDHEVLLDAVRAVLEG